MNGAQSIEKYSGQKAGGRRQKRRNKHVTVGGAF
jgi:hypothetical protein